MPQWLIEPQNEGQDLNYVEDFIGTGQQARKRAIKIKKGLQRLLPQGSFNVVVETTDLTKKFMV